MTPDEYDQRRGELFAMRRKYKGNAAVTFRINTLLGQLRAYYEPENRDHKAQLDRMIMQTLRDLGELTRQS